MDKPILNNSEYVISFKIHYKDFYDQTYRKSLRISSSIYS